MKRHFFIAVDIDPTVLDIFPGATLESVIEATLMSSRFLDNATVRSLNCDIDEKIFGKTEKSS